MSPRRAALALGVSEMTVYKYALLGQIAAMADPGQNVRFSADDVARLAAEREASAGRTLQPARPA